MNTSDNFVEKLNYYQSANTDSHTIKQNFVIRVSEFQSIIHSLSNKGWDDSTQHELILGRRGSGKSTLIKRVEIEILENKGLAENYIPINLAEEQASIYQLHDLWFETLTELQNKFDFNIELKTFDTFEKTQDYTRYLFFKIHGFLEKKKKKLVLLLDNFDRILENFKEDVRLLREFLTNYNNIIIIGGSTKINEHFWNYDKPFYDFFRQHLLKPLSFDEINVLLNSWSAIMNKQDLKDYAINNRGKIESIRILTDGMPRTLQFFIRVLLTDKEIYGFNYIKKIMDNATPLYQEKLNYLTPAQRKIVLEMAFIWEPTSTKELVNKCRMQSKLISSYLKQLESLGVVDKLDTKNRNKKYRISERFFNMWLIVTQGNPTQKRKAKYLTIFLENWYAEHEIKILAKEHLNKVMESEITYNKASVKTKALAQSKYINTFMRDLLIQSTKELINDDLIDDLPELSTTIIKKSVKLRNEGKYELALQEMDKLENENDALKYIEMSQIYYSNMSNYVNGKYTPYTITTKGVELSKKALFYLKKALNIIEEYKRSKINDIYISIYNQMHIRLYTAIYTIHVMNNNLNEFTTTLEKSVKLGFQFAKNQKAILNFVKNINKGQSLELVSEHSTDNETIIIALLIEIWNNKFDNVTKKLDKIFNKKLDANFLIKGLLFLQQKNLVLSYFESDKYGEELRDKYRLLYYATLILTNNIEEVHLKIPQEVLPTVRQIVQEIKEKNEFYNQPSKEV